MNQFIAGLRPRADQRRRGTSVVARLASVAALSGVLLSGPLAAVSVAQTYGQLPSVQYTSYWEDCEDTICFADPITFSLQPGAYFQSVSGGTKIYQDFAQGISYDWATDPPAPYAVSWAIGNYQNGSATWVGSNDNGQLTNGCWSVLLPAGESEVPCQGSTYNTNGHVFTGTPLTDWYVNYDENVGSLGGWDYSGGTSIAGAWFAGLPTTGYSEAMNGNNS